ncbi:SH3 domain-containing protein [Virgibacillus sp. JSM 102003]
MLGLQNRKKQGSLISGLFLLLLALILFSPNVVGATENIFNEKEEVVFKKTLVKEQIAVFKEEFGKVGTLNPDTVIYTSKKNENTMILQWGLGYAYFTLPQDNTKEVIEVDNTNTKSFSVQDLENFKYYTTKKDIKIFLDPELNNFIGEIKANQKVSIISSDEQRIELRIGLNSFYVKVDNAESFEQVKDNESDNLLKPQDKTQEQDTTEEEQQDTAKKESSSTNTDTDESIKQKEEEKFTTDKDSQLNDKQRNQQNKDLTTKTLNTLEANLNFSSNDEYFKVTQDNVAIVDSSSGSKVNVGKLQKGEVFKRVGSTGNWHVIKYADKYVYIWKDATKPASRGEETNWTNGSNHTMDAEALTDLPVYDNSNGSLDSFAMIDEGQTFKYVRQAGNWMIVEIGGREGYVYAPAVKRTFNTSDQYFEVIQGNVSIVDSSSGSKLNVGKLQKGEVFKRVGSTGNWHEIKYADKYVYIWKDATKPARRGQEANWTNGSNHTMDAKALTDLTVYDNSSGSLDSFAMIDEGQTFKYVKQKGNWMIVEVGGREGYVYAPAVERSFSAGDQYFEVIQDNVSIVDSSSGSKVNVGKLQKGEVFKRVGSTGNWHEIKYVGKYVYIWKDATKPANSANESNWTDGELNHTKYGEALSNLTVYDNSSGSLDSFAKIFKGQTFNYVEQNGKWMLVEIGGREGHVYAPAVEDGKSYTEYDISLEDAWNMQRKLLTPPQTDKYRNEPAYVRSNLIEFVDTAYITGDEVNLRNAPHFGDNISTQVNSGTPIIILGNVKGDEHAGSTNWYKIEYDGNTLYVHSSLANPNGEIARTTDDVNIRADKGTNTHIYDTVAEGSSLNITEKGSTWHKISYGAWRNATKNDTIEQMDPSNFINDTKLKFQFLNLSRTTDTSVSLLNSYLSGKGTLEGEGAAFIDAGEKYGVNEVYLMSHAVHETGNGGSPLAQGVSYNGRTVYNMYGIGAYDGCAISCGAKKAYEEGWFTPETAIIEGAAFIGNNYIKGENDAGTVQNTLYEMRWNPKAMDKFGYATHQYATDIGWASKQVETMYDLYQSLGISKLYLEIPVYK